MDRNLKKPHTFVVIWERKPKGSIPLLLVQNVRSLDQRFINQPSRTVFVGGGEEPEDKGNPFVTGIREVEEEAWLRYKGHGNAKLLCQIEEEETIKTFLLMPRYHFEGRLRDSVIMDGKDLIQPPVFLPIDEVGRVLYETHQPALLQLLHNPSLMD